MVNYLGIGGDASDNATARAGIIADVDHHPKNDSNAEASRITGEEGLAMLPTDQEPVL
jgi:hypothetical protein